jgi:DNA-binding winged helix-turn-helix (wHTH) protein
MCKTSVFFGSNSTSCLRDINQNAQTAQQCSLVCETTITRMNHSFSKENQISSEAVYRFGEFILDPADRRLVQGGDVLSLQPKALDALLLLVSHAGHLVSKSELLTTLWPGIHVSEANLTNIIVTLRKVLGRGSIRTLSKHGYRFEIPLSSEPGFEPRAYERFLEAREIVQRRSLEDMPVARDLLMCCLAQRPSFAQGWAWLGRCCLFLSKFARETSANSELAGAALRRALSLNPDLTEAHQFLTLMQVDDGQAAEAVARLLVQVQRQPDQPENYVGLVQAYRFEGLLPESIHAHERAKESDPSVPTSVAHTLFLAGDFAAAIEAYAGRAAYYLDAAAWCVLGLSERAAGLLHKRLETQSLSPLMRALMSSLLAVLQKEADEAVRIMKSVEIRREPEILIYFSRHYSQLGLVGEAEATLKASAQAGFTCAPETLRNDPWLAALREEPNFISVLKASKSHVERARSKYSAPRPPRDDLS